MRWKYFIPALLFVLLVAVFNIFFLDHFLKKAVIAGGERIFGAKVEIASLKTRFKNLSVAIGGLAVADRRKPMENMFEAGAIRFALKPLPLLEKKVIIEDMSVEGVRWGTRRSSSGALPRRAEKKREKESEKEDKDSITARLLERLEERARAEVSALPAAESLQKLQEGFRDVSVEKAADAVGLETLRAIDEMKAGQEKLVASYQERIRGLQVNERIERASAAINDAAKMKIETVEDVATAKERIDALLRSRDELQQSLNEVSNLQAAAQKDVASEKALMTKLDEIKDNDVKRISAQLRLPALTFGNVSGAIFGPLWLSRVQTAVYYAHVARKYMPRRNKDDRVIVRQRSKGRDIRFVRENVPPAFHVMRIALSGTTGGPGKEKEGEVNFRGSITDITSDPVRVGRPTRLEVSGTQGGRGVRINGVFDHTTEVSDDQLAVDLSGLKAEELNLPQSEFLPSFSSATATLSARYGITGGSLDCSLSLQVAGVRPLEAAAGDNVAALMGEIWSGISTLTLGAALSGTPERLNVSVESNVDKLLSQRLQALYGAKIAELQSRIKGEIDRLTAEKQRELLAQLNRARETVQRQLSEQESALRAKLDAAKAEISRKENQVRAQGESEKKKVEEEIRKKAEEKFKGLFDK